MAENTEAQQFIKQFALVYNKVDFFTFVEQILQAQVRPRDIWQEEKWNNFHQACEGVLRMSAEHLQRILDYTNEE